MAAKISIVAALVVIGCAQASWGLDVNTMNLFPMEHFMPKLPESDFLKTRNPGGFLPSIIGGHNVTRGSNPWHAVLIMAIGDKHGLCGASIVGEKHIMTASHCLWDVKEEPQNVTVFVNIYHLEELKGAKQYKAVKLTLHPTYTHDFEDSLQGDVAIIELEEKLTLNDEVKAIKTNKQATPNEGDNCEIQGFGRIDPLKLDLISQTLKSTTITVSTHDTCKRFNQNLNLSDGQLCMYSIMTSPCQGDSGGALTLEIEGEVTQVGIVSFGLSITCILFPHVQTNVYFYNEWIDLQIKGGN